MDNFSIILQICFGLVHLLTRGLPLYVFNHWPIAYPCVYYDVTIVANISRNYYAHDVFVMIGTNFLVQFDLRAIACFYFFHILEI
jgi:hypothetical protein